MSQSSDDHPRGGAAPTLAPPTPQIPTPRLLKSRGPDPESVNRQALEAHVPEAQTLEVQTSEAHVPESSVMVSRPRAKRPSSTAESRPLRLNAAAMLNAEGLVHEVALLRAAIRRLAGREDADPQVRTLAELRHQVEALCTALKTQQALVGHDDDLSADLARVLEDLGDELGVPR